MVAAIETYAYPVLLDPDDNDTVLASFPDFGEGATFGDDEADALMHALDLLETIIMARMRAREDIPLPSSARGRPTVSLPAVIAAKVALYRTMRDAGVHKAELARRCGWHAPQVDRLLDIAHNSRMDHLERALAVLGKRIQITLRDAA